MKSVKVIEFKLLDTQVIEVLERWRNPLRRIWNLLLARLNEYEQESGGYIAVKDRITKYHQRKPACQLPINYRLYYLDSNGAITFEKTDNKIYAPYSTIFEYDANYWQVKDKLVGQIVPSVKGKKSKTAKEWLQYAELSGEKIVLTNSQLLNQFGWDGSEGSYYSCPIGVDYRCPLLTKFAFNKVQIFSPADKGVMGLSLVTREDNLCTVWNCQELIDVPSKYRYSVVQDISISYQEYLKSKWGKNSLKRGKPKFKSVKEMPTSITNNNPEKKGVQVEGDYLCKVAHFGKIQFDGLSTRWRNPDGSIPVICVHSFVKRNNEWYVQLTGEFEDKVIDKKNKSYSVIACDLGIYRYATFSGQFFSTVTRDSESMKLPTNFIPNPRWLRSNETRLADLQIKLSHKLTHQLILLLNHPNLKPSDLQGMVRISFDSATNLIGTKTEADGVTKVGSAIWQRLKWQLATNPPELLGKGKAIARLQRKITKLHNTIKKNRRNFQHWLSFWISRNYDVFIAEDGLQAEKLKLKSKLKLDEDNRAIRNNKKAKSGLSKSLADGAFGQFLDLCQDKMLKNGKTFIRFACNGSSYTVFSADNLKGKTTKFKKNHPTTQECPVCSHKDKDLPYDAEKDPLHKCSNCGYECGRDTRPAILMCILLIEDGVIQLEDCSQDVQFAWHKRKKRKR